MACFDQPVMAAGGAVEPYVLRRQTFPLLLSPCQEERHACEGRYTFDAQGGGVTLCATHENGKDA